MRAGNIPALFIVTGADEPVNTPRMDSFHRIILLIIFLSICSNRLYAETLLEVSGIVSGRDPVVIVNNEVLKVGSKIQGYTVKDIRKDSVVFVAPDGISVTKMVEKKPEKFTNHLPYPTKNPCHSY
jgi:hypothetical protein